MTSDAETIQPALTPEEWASRRVYREHIDEDAVEDYVEAVSSNGHVSVRGDGSFVGADRHALAALLLDGEPFGFTQEEADAVAEAVSEVADRDAPGNEISPIIQRVAKKLAALLPPK